VKDLAAEDSLRELRTRAAPVAQALLKWLLEYRPTVPDGSTLEQACYRVLRFKHVPNVDDVQRAVVPLPPCRRGLLRSRDVSRFHDELAPRTVGRSAMTPPPWSRLRASPGNIRLG
jgi:hypothetical protein